MSALAIGLIGGIASGKSLVASYFEALGIDIIDTDQLARELVAPGTPCLKKIIDHFGPQLLLDSGELNRAALRILIFKDLHAKKWLENLLHPHIRNLAEQRVLSSTSPYCLVAIPLLKKREDYPFLKRILVIDTPHPVQLERLQKRDQIDLHLAQKMIAMQPSNEERQAIADDILINDSDPIMLQKQVQQLHERYLISR